MGGICMISPQKEGSTPSTSVGVGRVSQVVRVVPVTSSVSVVNPNRRVASYTFSSWDTYSQALAARPNKTTSTPVAMGSSVPVCPTFFVPNSFRTFQTTSCEVIPAGLSTSRMPSGSIIIFSVDMIVSLFIEYIIIAYPGGFVKRRLSKFEIHSQNHIRTDDLNLHNTALYSDVFTIPRGEFHSYFILNLHLYVHNVVDYMAVLLYNYGNLGENVFPQKCTFY